MSSSRTELANMGQYIAKLRKDKKYTQRQLGDMIDIPYKTISKWENGVVAPDITVLKNLADVLEVTVDEILCGEKLDSIQEKNSATIDGMKFYIRKSVMKILKIMLIGFGILFIFVSYFISVNNYYKWNVLDLNFSDNELFITGHITFNREKTLVVLDEFAYISDNIGTLDEDKVKMLKVTLYANDKEIVSNELSYSEPIFLHHCFESYYFIYDEKDYYNELHTGKIDIKITYVDENGKEHDAILTSKHNS